MIVVDTSIWIDLFRSWSDPTILSLRTPAEPLLAHEFVVGELMPATSATGHVLSYGCVRFAKRQYSGRRRFGT